MKTRTFATVTLIGLIAAGCALAGSSKAEPRDEDAAPTSDGAAPVEPIADDDEAAAPEPAPEPAPSHAGWTDDHAAALEKAAAEGKDLLLDFTGSDWCVWCLKLDEEVFSKESFQKKAPESFVLVTLDFPQGKKLPEKTRKQNNDLSGRFAVEGFPTIILTDATGRPYARTGYREGGAEVYLGHLAELRDKRIARDAVFEKAEASEGVARAKLLDTALQALDDARLLIGYDAKIDEIIAADAGDEAGLASKWKHWKTVRAAQLALAEIETLIRADKLSAGIAKIDEVMPKLEGATDVQQQALFLKAHAQYRLREKDAAIATLEKARALDPDSEVGRHVVEVLEQIRGGD